MNETTYETIMNGLKTIIVLPDEKSIDTILKQQENNVTEQKQLEKRYDKCTTRQLIKENSNGRNSHIRKQKHKESLRVVAGRL